MAVTAPANPSVIGSDMGNGYPVTSVPLVTNSAHSNPGANTQATCTIAAATNGARHVAVNITATLTAGAAVVGPLTLVLRDGASGTGGIIWQTILQAPANGVDRLVLPGMNYAGSPNTAMTLEFTAGPGANNSESVALGIIDLKL